MEEGSKPPIKKSIRKKGANIKRYVRPSKDHKDYQLKHSEITSQLKLVMNEQNDDTNSTTRLSTEPKE